MKMSLKRKTTVQKADESTKNASTADGAEDPPPARELQILTWLWTRTFLLQTWREGIKRIHFIMEKKFEIGPESPAVLKWTQGAKNPRKESQRGTSNDETTTLDDVNIGTLNSDTADYHGPPYGETSVISRSTTTTYKWEDVEDPTERRSSLARTPPQFKESKKYDTDEGTETYETPTGETIPEIARSLVLDLEKKALFALKAGNLQTSPQTPTSQRYWEDELDISPSFNLVGAEQDQAINQTLQTEACGDLQLIADNKESEERTDKPVQGKRKEREETPTQTTNKKEKQERMTSEDTTYENMRKVNVAMAKVLRRTNELKKLVNQSSKTKTEIKQVARELDFLVANLDKQLKNFERTHVCRKEGGERMTRSEETQTQPEFLKNNSTQTDWQDIEQEKKRLENATKNELNVVLKEDRGFENIAKLLDIDWPEEVYKNTRITITNQLNTRVEGDCAFLLDPKEKEKNKLFEVLMVKHPEIESMVKSNEGQIDYVINTVETRNKKQEVTKKTTALYILPLEVGKTGFNSAEDIYMMLRTFKDMQSVHPTSNINLIISERLECRYIRKICEYVFAGKEISVSILTPNRVEKTSSRRDTVRPQREKVVVKSGDMSYADLLKKVKNNININEVGVSVKSIKKTLRGDLMLEVEGDRQKAGALKVAIEKSVETDVRIANRETIIHVLDIDASMSCEEVKEAVNDAVGGRDGQMTKIRSIRPSRDGNQIATVQVTKTVASALNRKGRIKIGWVNCRVRERVTISRCFRCLEFGHRAFECKGPDKSHLCTNCNKPGHRSRECTGAPFCPTCETEHRADTTKCPIFRNLIKEQATIRRVAGGKETFNNEQ